MESMDVQETGSDDLVKRLNNVTVMIAKVTEINCNKKVITMY